MKSHNSLVRRAAMLAAFASILVLAGCGQKGPLFLPKVPPDPLVQTQPQAQSKPAASVGEAGAK